MVLVRSESSVAGAALVIARHCGAGGPSRPPLSHSLMLPTLWRAARCFGPRRNALLLACIANEVRRQPRLLSRLPSLPAEGRPAKGGRPAKEGPTGGRAPDPGKGRLFLPHGQQPVGFFSAKSPKCGTAECMAADQPPARPGTPVPTRSPCRPGPCRPRAHAGQPWRRRAGVRGRCRLGVRRRAVRTVGPMFRMSVGRCSGRPRPPPDRVRWPPSPPADPGRKRPARPVAPARPVFAAAS